MAPPSGCIWPRLNEATKSCIQVSKVHMSLSPLFMQIWICMQTYRIRRNTPSRHDLRSFRGDPLNATHYALRCLVAAW